MNATVTTSIWNLALPITTAAETIKIYFWNLGVLLVGVNNERQVSFATSITSNQFIDSAILERLILDEPALGGGEPITHVYLASNKSMLIPKQVYDSETSPGWLQHIHEVNYDETIMTATIAKPASYALNVVNEPILSFFKATFPNALIDNIHPLFIPYIAPEKPTLILSILDNTVVYAYYFEQKLINHQVEYGVNTSAVLLSIYAHFEHLNVAQENITIELHGYGHQFKAIQEFLSAYFQVQTITDTSFFNHLIVCE